MEQETFFGVEVIDLCESIMELHRALKAILMIFEEFDFEADNGNAFQGEIRKSWFKSVIDEMISVQYEKLDQIRMVYLKEQERI